MKTNIYVIAEYDENGTAEVTYETIASARILAGADPSFIEVVVLGRDVLGLSERLASETGLRIMTLEADALEPYTAEGYRKALTGYLANGRSGWVVIPHTARGSDYAPGLAVSLRASCITAVQDIDRMDGRPVFRRLRAWGKQEERIASITQSGVITVMPGAFGRERRPVDFPGKVSRHKVEITLSETKSCFIVKSPAGNRELDDAEVVVGAGLGVGSRENMALVRNLAGMFRRGAVGGSRAVCDRGWLEYRSQIGLTGRPVSPQLYIACGISGSIQHLAGITGAKTVVAVNKDGQASIFRHADVGVVADLVTFIPLLVAALRENPRDANLPYDNR